MSMQSRLGFEEAADRLTEWAPQSWSVSPDWQATLDEFLRSDDGQRLGSFVSERLLAGATIYPPRPLRALEFTPLSRVRVVIVGQDPYHGPGQAEGLAFSVAPGVRIPPSLRNIFRELGQTPVNGSLVHWAQRGVLLLNTCLTVEDGRPASHANRGWEAFTDAVLARVARVASPCVYLLWGAHAQSKAAAILQVSTAHSRDVLVLQANHPSPLSASRPPQPFLGCRHFDQARRWLAARGCDDPFG
ncbi:uracil-DNA glycosylase [Ramlibacter sp. AW1]|uniref:Uracil-DNA glycosylase n=1 Tax=Ramlibacter aurantiacus TaxID=2801330 RepID=A0A936ZQ05_9BURK|nr:uracil-DNA glycosylase [Ramlibacter aurantiacus]MBL0421435.1 uracil-DNA glycosylase [Ramlibacter aurantiacus]